MPRPEEYLDGLPPDRREALSKVRQVIVKNLPKGYEQVAIGRFIIYQVPLSAYLDAYHKQPLMYAGVASQKSRMAAYLCGAYSLPELRRKLEDGFRKAGKKPHRGASCVRFKRPQDLAAGRESGADRGASDGAFRGSRRVGALQKK